MTDDDYYDIYKRIYNEAQHDLFYEALGRLVPVWGYEWEAWFVDYLLGRIRDAR